MATLGCSQHVAYVQGKCAGPRLCELNVSSLGYDRRLDDISEAFVIVPISGDSDDPCCQCLADVEPWCHVLTIVREGDGVVWTGPIQQVIYGYNEVRIEASDKLAWLTVRVNEIATGVNPNPTFIPLTEMAKQIAEVAMAEDDSPCFLDCIVIDPLGDGFPPTFNRDREYPAFEGPTAYDDLSKLAESGIDFTVVNQCLFLGPEQLPDRAIGTLLDEHIMGEISVIKDGKQYGNRFFVRYDADDDCDVTCTPQGSPYCPCPAVASTDNTQCYGRVERLIPNNLGLPNITAAQVTAETLLEASDQIPRTVEFPAGTQLSPDTPWGINDMIPGQRINVALSKLCFPVFQSFKLQQVTVEDDADGEKISIDLLSLTTSTTL